MATVEEIRRRVRQQKATQKPEARPAGPAKPEPEENSVLDLLQQRSARDIGRAPEAVAPSIANAVDTVKAISGIPEGVASMATGLVGALGGTLAGADAAGLLRGVPRGRESAENLQANMERMDLFEFTPAFESVMNATNKVAQFQPRTQAGKDTVAAIAV